MVQNIGSDLRIGSRYEGMISMFCSQCGAPMGDNDKFCGVCGAPNTAAPRAAASASQPQFQPQPFVAPQPQQQYTGQYAQQSASAPMDYGPVKADRSLIGWLLLSLVTCGIYSFYFLYCLARDINVMCQDDGDSTPGLAAFILLSFVTCGFYAYYWYYKIGNRLQANAPRYGLVFQENGTTVLLWQIIGVLLCGLGPIFAMNIIINNTNAMATAYNIRLGAHA